MTRVSILAVVAAAALWAAQPAAQGKAPAAKPAAKPAARAATAGRLVELTAAEKGGKYSYEPSVITAKPGETLHVRLKSTGSMATMPKIAMSHNFVLLKPGTKLPDFLNAAIAAGFPANYIPAGMKTSIIASTPLAAIGETVNVTFKVPARGTYPFVCTFPGHEPAGMKGSLVVK